MARNDTTAAIVDSVLKLTVTSAALAAGLMAPNALIALDKPLKKLFARFDARSQERELRRVTSYMKSQKLVTGSYEHGLQITDIGRKRLAKAQFDNLHIARPTQWDRMWRIIFYDIPEEKRAARLTLTAKLRELGFFQLQRSVLVHPYPCRETIEKITARHDIDRFVSYIETSHIDNSRALVAHFTKRLPNFNS